MTPHNEAKYGEIAKNVLMPGDPLRAKYIADNFLEDCKLVNKVRNMYGYTGKYKGVEITVFASGMGMPSMGIYAYELYKLYDVENIIRIGTCGALSPKLELLDTILVEDSYTKGNFAIALKHVDEHLVKSDNELNESIIKSAEENNIKLVRGNVNCNEIFDYYDDKFEEFLESLPKDLKIIATEMESFALFYTAKSLGKKASCLLSVVDSRFKKEEVSTDDRQNSLNDMIKVALDAIIK